MNWKQNSWINQLISHTSQEIKKIGVLYKPFHVNEQHNYKIHKIYMYTYKKNIGPIQSI
jgi:hypothetical protein